MTARIGVTGGRFFADLGLAHHVLAQLPADAILVHGGAPGADSVCGEWWADIHGRPVEVHPARWDDPCDQDCRHGGRRPVLGMPDRCPAKGPRRNQEMVDSGLDLLIVFPGGRGTADMRRRAETAGVPIRVVDR